MSLKSFHLLFILLSIVLSAGFGLWSFTKGSPVQGMAFLGGLSLVAMLGLLVYLKSFLQKFKAVSYY